MTNEMGKNLDLKSTVIRILCLGYPGHLFSSMFPFFATKKNVRPRLLKLVQASSHKTVEWLLYSCLILFLFSSCYFLTFRNINDTEMTQQ